MGAFLTPLVLAMSGQVRSRARLEAENVALRQQPSVVPIQNLVGVRRGQNCAAAPRDVRVAQPDLTRTVVYLGPSCLA